MRNPLIFFLAFFIAFSAQAIEIVYKKTGVMLLSGTIQDGDLNRLIGYILDVDAKNGTVTGIDLHSGGGDVKEALKIAELVRVLRVGTRVPRDAHCASSCFFVFLAGDGRTAKGAEIPIGMGSLGRVGLHRPYLVSPSNSSLESQTKGMKYVKTYLENRMVPTDLIDKMMSRPSNQIYWMNTEDLERLGVFGPELEELYINKCKYNRNDLSLIAKAELAGRHDEVAWREERQIEINRCVVTLSMDGYFKGIKKLRSGWRPS